MVENPAGRIILTISTHQVPFGIKNVPNDVGGEHGYGEEPGAARAAKYHPVLMPA